MKNRKLRLIFKVLSVGFVMFLLVFPALAELDPNPNSPTPILISQPGSTRALAQSADIFGSKDVFKSPKNAFQLDQKIDFVCNECGSYEWRRSKCFSGLYK